MSRTNQWEEFFDSHAPSYMENPFTKNTVAEVDFILEELGASHWKPHPGHGLRHRATHF